MPTDQQLVPSSQSGLGVGDAFPAVPVHDESGPVDLSARWVQGPLIIAFHRLWCPFCQQAMYELDAVGDELRAVGGDAVVIYRDDAATVAERCRDRGISFDGLSDPDHTLERAARVAHFRAHRYAAFAPTRLVRALRAGGRIGAITSHPLQGRGTYVVDRDGRIAYAHISASAADIPSAADLLGAVRRAAGRS